MGASVTKFAVGNELDSPSSPIIEFGDDIYICPWVLNLTRHPCSPVVKTSHEAPLTVSPLDQQELCCHEVHVQQQMACT